MEYRGYKIKYLDFCSKSEIGLNEDVWNENGFYRTNYNHREVVVGKLTENELRFKCG